MFKLCVIKNNCKTVRCRSKWMLLVVVLLMSGCTTKISYNFLDWYVRWYVKSYVSLERQQKIKVRYSVKKIHDWHRSNELPVYAGLVDEVSSLLAKEQLRAEDLHAFSIKSQSRLVLTWQVVAEQLAELLPLLSDSQAEEFSHNLEKKTRKYYEKFVGVDREKRHKSRVKRMRKFLQSMVGRLNDQQVEMVRQWSLQLDDSSALHYQQRVVWREHFAKALEWRRKPEVFNAEVHMLVANSRALWSEEYNNTVQADRMLTWQLLVDLHSVMSARQKQRLKKYLSKLRDDFHSLSRS